jgi:ribosomal protein L12E/L44/L45/RPP1/RPP2
MKYLAAYALAVLGGKEHPAASDIATILASVDADFDQERANTLVTKLQGKALHEVIASALTKLQSVAVSAAPAAPSAAPVAVAKKVEAKPKEEEEEDDVGGGNMFADDEW